MLISGLICLYFKLIAQSCDVIAASCHAENIMDLVFNALDSDGVMPMSTTTNTNTTGTTVEGNPASMSGESYTTVDVADSAVVALLNEMAPAADKDALMILRRRMHECLQEADVKVPKQLGKVSANQLLKLASLVTDQIHERHPGLVDMLLSVTEALQRRCLALFIWK